MKLELNLAQKLGYESPSGMPSDLIRDPEVVDLSPDLLRKLATEAGWTESQINDLVYASEDAQ